MFLYFIPGGSNAIDRAKLCEAGLGYVFGGRCDSFRHVETTRGPEGTGQGVLVSLPGENRLGLFPDRQKWQKVPGSQAFVGMYSDADPPAPRQLLQDDPLAGHEVALGDGRRWCVPIALAPAENDGQIVAYSPLPRKMGLDAAGKFTPGDIELKYEGLWAAVAAYQNSMAEGAIAAGEDAERFSFELDDEWAVDVLQANYRLGRAEIVLLGLLTWQGPFVQKILDAASDAPAFELLKKKLDSAGSSSNAGPPACTPATDRPSPT